MKNLLKKIYKTPLYEEDIDRDEREAFAKAILSFYRPVENPGRFGQDIEGLVEYDLMGGEGHDKIGGHLPKRFVRLRREYFSDYLDLVKASIPNNYVSYLDDESVMADDFPHNLSVLIKMMPRTPSLDYFLMERKKMTNEVLASRIMNFFGVKTVYNKSFQEHGNFYVMSLDCLKPGQEIYMAEEYDDEHIVSCNAMLKHTFSIIDEKLDIVKTSIKYETGRAKPKSENEKIKREYVKAYLVRFLLLGDRDFTDRNYGFVYNKKTRSISDSPNFDYELAFSALAENARYFGSNMEWVAKNYPDILEDFMTRLKDFVKVQRDTKRPLYANFVHEFAEGDDLIEIYEPFLQKNSKILLSWYDEFEKNNQKSSK